MNPGDIVVGDDDGVVVVPRKQASEVLAKARQRIEKEHNDREQFLKRVTSMKMYDFEQVLQSKHVQQVDEL